MKSGRSNLACSKMKQMGHVLTARFCYGFPWEERRWPNTYKIEGAGSGAQGPACRGRCHGPKPNAPAGRPRSYPQASCRNAARQRHSVFQSAVPAEHRARVNNVKILLSFTMFFQRAACMLWPALLWPGRCSAATMA